MGAGYDDGFYRGLSEASGEGAGAVVPLVMELVAPTSVVDLGCGVGSWLRVFAAAGVDDIVGLDQPAVPRDALEIPTSCFQPTDLTRPVQLDRTFDLAVSLEVGEHLPETAVEAFVASLTGLAPTVLFSAAIPHQTGTGHITCRWPGWWGERFATHGFEPYDVLRPRLWDDGRIPDYYRQNLVLYAHPDRSPVAGALTAARAGGDFGGAAIVHPERWEALHDPTRVPLGHVARVAPGATVAAARRALDRIRRRRGPTGSPAGDAR